ncbi:hypothetical protein LuPra_05119 [Luteitalea pratensis]|uniref:Uncharacterized protein n=1 Tax=Luteitalea pratensis TaxID=1855912 RepID=A0A143PVJ5_LUTPR|nr:hypothetical protein LuPra_05119 [Luteitalea pratensis]
MAAFWVNADECQSSEPRLLAENLWAHYETAGFLYPAKLAMLRPFKAGILDLWQRLIEAPADVFQVHYARQDLDKRFVAVQARVERDACGRRSESRPVRRSENDPPAGPHSTRSGPVGPPAMPSS